MIGPGSDKKMFICFNVHFFKYSICYSNFVPTAISLISWQCHIGLRMSHGRLNKGNWIFLVTLWNMKTL